VIDSDDKAYELPQDGVTILSLPQIHRDPLVYGDDADEVRPERMLDENFNKLPKNAWKPFGSGMRGCIGRPFAIRKLFWPSQHFSNSSRSASCKITS